MWCSYANLCWSWAHFENFGNLLGSFKKCLEISWQAFWSWCEHCGNIQIQKDQNCLEINFRTVLKNKNKLELLDLNLEPEVLIRLDLWNPKSLVQENLTQTWTHQVFIFWKYSQNPKPEDLWFCKKEISRLGANNSSKNQELANIDSNLSFQHFTQKLICIIVWKQIVIFIKVISLYCFTMFMWCNICCNLSVFWFTCVVWSKKKF